MPNAVTLVRLGCLPVFLWLLLVEDRRIAAGLLLGFLGATDWVDGYLARRLGQVSDFGKVFDPTVDRLVLIVGVAGIIIVGGAPPVFSALVVGREVLVGGAMATLTLFGMKRIDVTWWGKAGTFCLMFAFPMFLGGSAGDDPVNRLFTIGGWGFGIPGLLFSYYAAYLYVPLMRNALREGREARQR